MNILADEAAVATAFCRLATNGELHKVRLCEQCKENWRVSERQIDRFCSRQCRVAADKARTEFKEQRKMIQKNWRINAKRKAAKALRDLRAARKGRS